MKIRILSILALLFPVLAFATAPTCVVGKVGIAPAATLTFTAPTTNTDGTPIATPLTYDLFEGTSPSTLYPVAKGLTGSPVTVNTGLKDGTTVYFDLTVVDAHGTMSAPSNVVCKMFPSAVPGTVTITIT
jgi:hypothetical protein